jgi:aminoglycoside phosphotransferase (APT) family kinase protein
MAPGELRDPDGVGPAGPLLDRRSLIAPEVERLLREAGRPRLRLRSWRWTTALAHGSALLLGCQGRYVGPGEETLLDLMVKLYPQGRHDRAARSYLALNALHRAGFRAPGRARVPRPYGCSPFWGFTLQERAGGTPWADRLLAGERERRRASRQAASWLLRLQRLPALDWPSPPEDEPARTQRHVDELALGHPEHAPALRAVGDEIVRRLDRSRPTTVAHGDYHPKNVLIDGDVVTVLDFDAAARRDVAFDPGYAIGQALVMPFFWRGAEALGPGADAASAFWEAYREGGGRAEEPGLTTYVARTVLQALHYASCIRQRSLAEGLGLWSRLISEWLDRGWSPAPGRRPCPAARGRPTPEGVSPA